MYAGGTNVTGIFYALNDSPLFALAGSIIPLTHPRGAANVPDPLCMAVFPVSSGSSDIESSYTLYEDDGESTAALNGGEAFSQTVLNATVSTRSVSVSVGAAMGTFDGALSSRGVEVHLRGFAARAASPSTVVSNGTPVSQGNGPHCAPCWWIVEPQAHTLALPEATLVVEVGRWSTGAPGMVTVEW